MITLKHLDRLIAVVSVPQSTSPVSIITSWRTTSTGSYVPDGLYFNISDNTITEIVPNPGLQTQHNVDYINVYNSDSVAHIINISILNNAISYPIKSILLTPNEGAEYNDKEGWKVFANNGAIKQVYANGTSPIGSNVNMIVLNSPVVNNNAIANTMQDVSGLSFAVNAGSRYRFKFMIFYTAAAGTTGSRWSINGPGSPTELIYDSDYSLTSLTRTINTGQSGYDVPAASNASSAVAASNIAIIEGMIVPSTNGIVIARFASEVSGSAITARPGSYVEFQQLT